MLVMMDQRLSMTGVDGTAPNLKAGAFTTDPAITERPKSSPETKS